MDQCTHLKNWLKNTKVKGLKWPLENQKHTVGLKHVALILFKPGKFELYYVKQINNANKNKKENAK